MASKLRNPTSKSTTQTLLSACTKAKLRFAAVVDLPTPPLPDVTTIDVPMIFSFSPK